MHIALVTGGYWGVSGVFTHVRDLSIHLARRGQDVTVFTPDAREGNPISEGVRLLPIKDIPLIPQVIFYAAALAQQHGKAGIDIAHVHDSIAFLGAYLFSKRFNVPTVFTFHASIFSPAREMNYAPWQVLLYRFTNRFAARRADRVIGVSKEMVECARYAGASAEKSYHITNFIDLASFGTAGRIAPEERDERRKVCLYVGALQPAKGVKHLLSAIPLVRQRIPEVRLLIIGDGPSRNDLQELAARLGISDAVRFVGSVPREKLVDYYQQADLLVVPSLDEPQGIVVLEAMACGLPVIGTKVGGIPEMISHGQNGLLVEPGDPAQLGNAIVKLLVDHHLRQRLSSKALVTVQEFSWQRNIDRFLQLYRSLCPGTRQL